MVGGTCVNRGCVPSKALLAVSGRMRELRDDHHLKLLGLQVKMLCIRMGIVFRTLEYSVLRGREIGCIMI